MNRVDPAENISNVLTTVVRSLVDNPELVAVTHEQLGVDSFVFHVRAEGDDVGKLIGKRGRTAQALRLILSSAGIARKVYCSLDIVEGNGARA